LPVKETIVLALTTIREVQVLLRRYLPVTRLVPALSLSCKPGQSVWLKLESELPTGSFKPRGALYALSLNCRQRDITEVTASSTGNHGAAVAYAAKQLGIPATIFLPANSNPVKRATIAALGAKIFDEGLPDLSAAFEQARLYSQKAGVYFLNDASDPDLPAGPATIACEIFDQLPACDTIVIPMGDTALIRGVAAAAKHLWPAVRIIGVQAERAPSYFLSWKQGRPISTETCDTIADGLATRVPQADNVTSIRNLVDEVVLVSDEQMRSAIGLLALEEHVIAEPAGAATTAALLSLSIASLGRNIVLLVTGANVSRNALRSAICPSA
jgi:threonine dehydratase